MKKVLLAVAAASGAIAVTLLKRRGDQAPADVENTANTWATAVGEAAEKAAGKMSGVAQTAAAKADIAAQRLGDAASTLPADNTLADKAAATLSNAAATVGAAVADAADATGETLGSAARATSQTAAEAAASAARAAAATRSELDQQR